MRGSFVFRLLVFIGAATAAAFAHPTLALAHASDRGFVLLLPTGYYLAGGALAVMASFVALVLMPRGLFARIANQRLPLFRFKAEPRFWTSLIAFLVLCALITSGFLGSRDPLSNPLPLTIWTLLWIGLTLIQGLLGDVWWWINPWHAPVRVFHGLLGRLRLVKLPGAVQSWPAVILFFGFAWFELIYPAPDDPFRLATVVLVYFLCNLTGAVIFGAEPWLTRVELFSVFFSMIARLGIIGSERRIGGPEAVSLRWPGAKLWVAEPLPISGVFFLLLALASVSFDGLSKTFFWLGLNGINPLEYPGRTALMATNSAGLLATFALLSAAFLAAVFLGEILSGRNHPKAAIQLLVWSLAPIALAYHFAHYLTAFAVNAQYALVAISDPFAMGWNLFGTAQWQVSAGIVSGSGSAWWLWNMQAGAIILGHVVGVLVAHMMAERLPQAPRPALAELPLTILMVCYTLFGLWLLSTPTAG